MQNITAAESAELIASGSTIVSSPVLTGMLRMLAVVCVFFCGIFVLPVLELEELLLLLLFDGGCRSRSRCLIRSVVVRPARIVPAARSAYFTSSAALAVISPALRLDFCPAAASSSCSPSSAVSASAVSVCSSATTLPDRLTAIGWIKRETSETR